MPPENGPTFGVCSLVIVHAILVEQAPLTIDMAVESALRRHPALSAARKDRDAAVLGSRSAAALANPHLLLSPAIGSINGTTEELLLTQPLELNGSRTARRKLATARSTEAVRRLEAEARGVVALVKGKYIDLWRERMLLALAEASRDDLAAIDTATRRQVELGGRAGVDATRSGLERVRAEQRVVLARGRVKSAEAALSVAMGLDATTQPGPLESPAVPTQGLDLESALAGALAARGDLAAETALVDALRFENALVRTEGLPDLAPQFRSQQVLTRKPTTRDYGFSVAIQWPVLDWGGRRARLAQGDAQVAAQRDRVDALRRTVAEEVASAHARWVAAQAVLAGTEEAAAGADRLLEAVRIGHREGSLPLPTVLDAQRAHRETLAERIEAKSEAMAAWIALEHAAARFPIPGESVR